MRKLLIGIIILSLLVPSVVSVSIDKNTQIKKGNILYVGGSGEGNYTKIQDAIDNATDGDTVFVFSGTYYERKIMVDKSLNIIGQDKNNTVIDCQFEDYPFAIIVDNVYLFGFKMLNSGTYPTWNLPGVFVNSNNIRIENNIILNMKGAGIIIWDERNNNIINDNVISKCEYGVALRYDSYNNDIYNNRIFDNEYAILFNSGDADVYDNTIYDNEYGMYITHVSNTKIHNNQVFNNEYGIILDCDCSDNIIAENIVYKNEVGLLIQENKYYHLIQNNVIHNNSFGVIFSYRCNNIEVTKNEISDNDLGILLFWGSNGNIISQNNLIGNDKNADFGMFSIINFWRENYWNEPKTQPYIIRGRLGLFLIPWINIDWHPAQEPYDIKIIKNIA